MPDVDPNPPKPPPPPDPIKGALFEDKAYKKAYKKYLYKLIAWSIKRLIELK